MLFLQTDAAGALERTVIYEPGGFSTKASDILSLEEGGFLLIGTEQGEPRWRFTDEEGKSCGP